MRPLTIVPALALLLLLLLSAAGSLRAFVVPVHHQRQRRSSARFAEIGPLPGPAAAPSQAPPPAPAPAPAPAPPAKPLLRVLGPDGKELRTFEAKAGANLRKTLQAQKLDVYDLMGKMTNCNGAGQCGTCAVKLESDAWGPRSEYEATKLAKKYGSSDETYRLACQTLVEAGEATVTLRPPPPKKKK